MSVLVKIRRIFSRNTKIKLVTLLFAIIIGATLETVALSIISPFISILMDNSMVKTNRYINFIYKLLGFNSISSFLVLLSFSLALVYIFRGVYLYILNKAQYRFIGSQRVDLSDRLLTKVLNKSYVFHATHNIAEMQRIILTDVEQLFALINNVLLFCADSFMSLFIVAYLLIISPPMTICMMSMACICVLIYFKIFRQQINEAGSKSRKKYIDMTKSVNQALGGIKEVKVLHREEYFQREFKKNSDSYIAAYQKFQVINAMPKLFIESFCFGGAFIIIGILLAGNSNVQSMIPQLSMFVLAAFRLLPATSRLVNYVTSILYYRPSVNAVYTSLYERDDDLTQDRSRPPAAPEASLDIVIAGVTFRYPQIQEPVLENVTLTIPEKKSIALVGPSGAGKTTLSDIMLGILTPQEGAVFYNGKSIHQDFAGWSKNVGYIPQQIYLLDETILENVAFGIDKAEIDEAKVWRALEQAQLRDFVEKQPGKLQTIIGDRGIRLSGGQRQRIGIARALYCDPSIIVFDEATSSLDNETEAAVMEAVQGLQGSKTMLIIAHRLSTIQHCDIIYRVGEKKVEREK